MTEGCINIIDVPPTKAHQSRSGRNPDGSWHIKQDSHGNKKSTYGYSVHVGVDEDGFVHRQ